VQVARSLGRAVPLSPQLIFTPTASVTAVQSINTPPISGQVILTYTSLTYSTSIPYIIFCHTKISFISLRLGAELGSPWPAGGAHFLHLSVSVTETKCETVPRGVCADYFD